MQTILAAVDGSDHAFKAFDFAVDLADKYGARLIALYAVTDRPLSDAERRMAENEYLGDIVENLDIGGLMESKGDPRLFARELLSQHGDTWLQVRQAIAKRYLQEAVDRAEAKGFRGTEQRIEQGDPVETVLYVAETEKADCIVTGSRGLSDFAASFLGSVSHQISHRADCTVINVK